MKEDNRDIFDKLMSLPGINTFDPFFQKNREVLLYLFFGGVSFVLNMALYILLNAIIGMNELLANVLCWIACVLFQFVTNRIWVFDGRTDTMVALVRQMTAFFSGRIGTLIVEESILLVFITWLRLNSVIVKLVAQFVVIVLNYIISKMMVFRS